MSTVRKMSNVSIAMQSALGVSKTITAISKASSGVITATHDFSVGDFVALEVVGMSQLNGKVYRVAAVSTTASFQLADVAASTMVDTSDFDTFTSGNAKKITFGTSITTASNISMSGGEFDFIDTTVIHANQKTQIPGAANAIKIDLTHLWDITDTGQIAMKKASDSQTQTAFKFTFGAGGPIMVFTGYVGYIAAPTGSALDKITSPSTITAFGTPNYYVA